MVSPYILAAHALCMSFGESQTSKICGLPSKVQHLCRTHLAFVVAVVAAVAAVVGLCYTVSIATRTAIPHIMPSDIVFDMLAEASLWQCAP